MKAQFRTLLTIAVAHPYYRGNCQDIQFLITSDIRQLAANGKLLFREVQGRFTVLFEADETGAALASLSGQILRLGIKLGNPFFSHFTQTSSDFAASQWIYRNTLLAAALDPPRRVAMTGPRLSHPLADHVRPVTILLKDASDRLLQLRTIGSLAEEAVFSCDLTLLPPGNYMVQEAYPASSRQTDYYWDAELWTAGAFGVLEIKLAGEFYTAPPQFQLSFAPRSETLKYYVLAAHYTTAEINQLSVVDKGFTEEQRPEILFDKVLSNAFGPNDLSPALFGGNSNQVVLFKSQAPVSRSEIPRKKIQLNRNGTVLIGHLPQPGADRPHADLIITITKS